MIEDYFNSIKLVKRQDGHYYMLVIDNLKVGEYYLAIARHTDSFRIKITVHNGDLLGNMDNIILKPNCLQELTQS